MTSRSLSRSLGAVSIHREYPDAITSTGGTSSPAATFPCPSGSPAGGNQKSSCTRPPGSYAVRPAGSCGRYSGRSSPTRSRSTVIDRSQPIRSATTVAGIVGHSASCSRIAGSPHQRSSPSAHADTAAPHQSAARS